LLVYAPIKELILKVAAGLQKVTDFFIMDFGGFWPDPFKSYQLYLFLWLMGCDEMRLGELFCYQLFYAPTKTVPGDYLDFMLPGMVFQSEKAEDRVCDIDPNLIIGASWQGYGAPPDPETEMDGLNSSTSRYPWKSTCRLLKNTSIHIAGEGKNRIELFRYHKRKVSTRISTVIPIKYPVIRRDMSGQYWIASWRQDNGIETFATIPFPDITLPVYRLLGVEIDGKRMPVPLDAARKSLASAIDEIAGRICQA